MKQFLKDTVTVENNTYTGMFGERNKRREAGVEMRSIHMLRSSLNIWCQHFSVTELDCTLVYVWVAT